MRSHVIFADIFYLIIEERHNGFKKTDMHNTDQDECHVLSSSPMRTGRSIRSFNLPPYCQRAERRKVSQVLDGLKGAVFSLFSILFVFDWFIVRFFLFLTVTTNWKNKEKCVNTFEYFI